jgi:hypothetical protein
LQGVDKRPRLFLFKAADLPDGNAAVLGSPFDKLRMNLTMREVRGLHSTGIRVAVPGSLQSIHLTHGELVEPRIEDYAIHR